MNMLQNKKVLQDQAQDAVKQIEKSTNRKNDLQKQLDQTLAGIESLKLEINRATYDGKDTSGEVDVLQREKTKADGLQGALTLADEQIKKFETQREDAKRKLGAMEILEANDKAERQMLVCIDKLHDAISVFEGMEQILSDFRAVRGKHPSGANSDRPHQMSQVYDGLNVAVMGGGGLIYSLNQLENGYHNYLKIIREENSG